MVHWDVYVVNPKRTANETPDSNSAALGGT